MKVKVYSVSLSDHREKIHGKVFEMGILPTENNVVEFNLGDEISDGWIVEEVRLNAYVASGAFPSESVFDATVYVDRVGART